MEEFILNKAKEFAKIIYEHPAQFNATRDAKEKLTAEAAMFLHSNKASYFKILKIEMQKIFAVHLQECLKKDNCPKRIALKNIFFLIDQEIKFSPLSDDKEWDKYYDKYLEKRADQADFFLDMIIEKGLIKLDKLSIRKYFKKWFEDTQEFDLQIKDGDFVMEDGDLQSVPEFSKNNIPEFLKWFENEGTNFIQYLKTQGVEVNKDSKERIINTGNLIINENSKIKNQRIDSGYEKKESNWSKTNVIIALISAVVGLITLLWTLWG